MIARRNTQNTDLFREQIEERLKEMNPMNVPMNGSSHLTHEAAISGEATWPIRRQVPLEKDRV